MCDARIIRFSEPELRNPVAFIGMPTVGLVGSILAGHMAREMKLPVIGGITSPDYPPYAFITNGRPCPQIRVIAGTPARPKRRKTESAEEEPKASPAPRKRTKPRDVVIVTSEITPKPEQVSDTTDTILDYLECLGVKEVVCLEGAAPAGTQEDMMAVGNCEAAWDRLSAAGIKIMTEGIIRGVTGSALLEGSIREMDVSALMISANTQLPDPRAAARLAEPVMALYPRLRIDTSPLFKEAEDIESRIQAQLNQQNPSSGSGIYG